MSFVLFLKFWPPPKLLFKVPFWTYEWILLVNITFSYGLIILFLGHNWSSFWGPRDDSFFEFDVVFYLVFDVIFSCVFLAFFLRFSLRSPWTSLTAQQPSWPTTRCPPTRRRRRWRRPSKKEPRRSFLFIVERTKLEQASEECTAWSCNKQQGGRIRGNTGGRFYQPAQSSFNTPTFFFYNF